MANKISKELYYENSDAPTMGEIAGTQEELEAEYQAELEAQRQFDEVDKEAYVEEIDDLLIHGEASINALSPEYKEVHVVHVADGAWNDDRRDDVIEALALGCLRPYTHDYLVRVRYEDGRYPQSEVVGKCFHFDEALAQACWIEKSDNLVVEIWNRRHYMV